MTWVDGIVLAVVALSALVAFTRGFVRETLGVGAWVGALAGAAAAMPLARPWVEPLALDPAWLGDVLAFAAIFVAALIVLKILLGWVAELVSGSLLGGVDRALGLGFGAARGALLLVVAYVAAGILLPATDRWPAAIRQSAALPLVADGAQWLVAFLPAEYRPRVPDVPPPDGPTQRDLLRPAPESRT